MGVIVTGIATSASAGAAAASRLESSPPAHRALLAAAEGGRVEVVGAENEYANVAAQVGGRFVLAKAIMSNPNADPHAFEASPSVAQEVAGAKLVIQNGLGYDAFMNTIEQAAPSSTRKVVVVQQLLHLPKSTANPHLWYDPRTMPAVAKAVEKVLASLRPAHAAYFERRLATFDAALVPWTKAIRRLRDRFAGAPVATTEPVADDLLKAAGIDDETPFSFQADVMNGVDPSPQAVALEQGLLKQHRVKAFIYNEQVTDTLTQNLLAIARAHHVPVVGVYETMPTGYNYERWMEVEVSALVAAFTRGVSANRL